MLSSTLLAGFLSTIISLSLVTPSVAAPPGGMYAHQHRQLKPVYLENKFNRVHHDVSREALEPLAALDEDAKAVVARYQSYREGPYIIANASTAVTFVKDSTKRTLSELPTEDGVVIPTIKSIQLLGTSVNNPEQQYLNIPSAPLPSLPPSLLLPELEYTLSKENRFYNGSGNLQVNSATRPFLESMKWKPRFARDGGMGGNVNGNKLFVFADTQTYGTDGSWAGFVSNSVAADIGDNAMLGRPPILQDKLGEFCNNIGTMRNFIPFTLDEAAYNSVMAGKGQRFGVWPLSSLIPYGEDSALLYAPVIYTNTQAQNVMNYVGTTLVLVTVPGPGGAVAERIAPMLFQGPGIEWGCIGGIRKLSYAGRGRDELHGRVYILGKTTAGLVLGRVQAPDVINAAAYDYYHPGSGWSSISPTEDSSDEFLNGAYSTVDIFYAPKYQTFIMTFMTTYADNKFYWRFLKSDRAITPTEADDYVESITQYPWSDAQVLLETPAGSSYSYAGGMYRGYFDDNDITNGGNKMLVGWTKPTGEDAASGNALAHVSSVITFA